MLSFAHQAVRDEDVANQAVTDEDVANQAVTGQDVFKGSYQVTVDNFAVEVYIWLFVLNGTTLSSSWVQTPDGRRGQVQVSDCSESLQARDALPPWSSCGAQSVARESSAIRLVCEEATQDDDMRCGKVGSSEG